MSTDPSVIEIPDVAAYIVADRQSGQYAAYVLCGYCGCVHKHGAGPITEPPDLGARLSHCQSRDPAGYRLVPGLDHMPTGKTFRERQRDLEEYDRRRGVTYQGGYR